MTLINHHHDLGRPWKELVPNSDVRPPFAMNYRGSKKERKVRTMFGARFQKLFIKHLTRGSGTKMHDFFIVVIIVE